MRRARVGVLVMAVQLACGTSGRDAGVSGSGLATVTAGDTGTGGGDAPGSGDGVDDGPKLDVAPPGGGDVPADDECAAVSEEAELEKEPADIVIVVDNSGSMIFEAGEVQAQLNSFSQQITDSGIDFRVVLVSSYPFFGFGGICIEPPLGAGGCPLADNNPPGFLHVNQTVDSHNAWELLVSTHSQWGSTIRDAAGLHLLVISDDASDMPFDEFDTSFRALDSHYEVYVHHSVVCHSECPLVAAGIGTDYIMASDTTGGVASDLCLQDFQSVFDALTTAVVTGSSLSCEFAIPEPPDGQEFDPGKVNVELDDNGNVTTIGYVETPAECDGVTDGWHYDDPAMPTQIVLCPDTCMNVQGIVGARIDIQFGCATIPSVG